MKIIRVLAPLSLFVTPLSANFTLTILHFNDAESHLVSAGDPATDPDSVADDPSNMAAYGGAARFVGALEALRAEADGPVLTISAGDNIIPGPALDASNPGRNPANAEGTDYDALFFAMAKVDASVAGNHDFDMGPDNLAKFASDVQADGGSMKLVSCNLDSSANPKLAPLLAPYAVFDCDGHRVGVVGATTWQLSDLSSPGLVHVIDADDDGTTDIDDTALLVQKNVDELTAQGVDCIILVAHLQSIRNDQALLRKLRGVDVGISGGGHETLSDMNLACVPGSSEPVGAYPLYINADGAPVRDRDGVNVPVVTAGSALRYVGRLRVEFDDSGSVVTAKGGMILVSPFASDKVANARPFPKNELVDAAVVRPVLVFIQSVASRIVAVSRVPLDGLRRNVRAVETNLGDLVADAVLAEAQRQASEYGLKRPAAAVVNGGAIRIDAMIPEGELSGMQIRGILPFTNYVTIVESVNPSLMKAIAERMLASAGRPDGAFGQISGFSVRFDPSAAPGSRVVAITLDDGTRIVDAGAVCPGAPNVSLATLNYLARGGDGYPLATTPSFVTPVQHCDALNRFLEETLGGKVDAAAYPKGGLGRIAACGTAQAEAGKCDRPLPE